MTEPILQVKDLSVYYNKKKALNSVTLDFLPNEITALIGPSGSGKSTLLKAINRMGDLNPEVTTTGTVLYNEHNIYGPRTDTVELRKRNRYGLSATQSFPNDYL
ncbi:Phosphate transport ATP-binding protein PstB [Streptococcus gordonii]|uniref:Phosphate transport ATP-binding protein PstB n=1 Tax=Streptococcus gordonii TaxID=1302 RepID=A0A139N9Q6_STRGN|nr:Phosphate transport ATP-binding protein PstB [Streptococcus gordonii]